ncbi:unnamed protein product [Schistosoma mattheei]|uniref:Uncharacterized protein n=1 Tax=Schistosoma mattheei TaxID=31246 RepID=A0A3P8E457_9TREM|nr:unnamed protein product [Schistosoma mattheei]
MHIKQKETSKETLPCDISTGRDLQVVPKRYRRNVFNTLHKLSHPGVRATINAAVRWHKEGTLPSDGFVKETLCSLASIIESTSGTIDRSGSNVNPPTGNNNVKYTVKVTSSSQNVSHTGVPHTSSSKLITNKKEGCTKIQETRSPSPPPHSTDATSAVLGGPYNKPSYQPTDICTNIPTNQHSLGQSNLAQKTSPQISPQSVVTTDSNKALPSSVWSVQTNNNPGSRVSEPSPRGGQKIENPVRYTTFTVRF